ncbi:hypothetical protein BC936DRAFT_148898 [Jimgerdemannia flammicorona]|uniref:Oxidoreductase FAD/NAD(P)-binding domain-containing protein n=1 Tax=Jimgerdemannia flammicorona TaxID=994334 RepID=A0A433D228_9FUNG|nr:hypothetical protein BC936DRAFT_148898 [Jimgerdemannia flammicorona]
MYAYCQRVRRTLAEVLSDFSSARIPLDYLLDLVPELRPRQFSIASAAQEGRVYQVAGDVKTWWGFFFFVGFLSSKNIHSHISLLNHFIPTTHETPPGDKICHVKIARGTMRPPSSPTTPLIMIGPGTGVAPMRGILESRIHEGATDNVLFFGCRYRDKDYLYADEWAARTAEGCLTVFTAFSRDQDHKVYVQDRILENAVLVWRLIDERGAVVLLCGTSTKMPEQVAYALKRVFMIEGGLDAAEAEQYYAGMEKSGRMQTETWS